MNAWEQSLLDWNTKHVDVDGPQRDIMVCADCLLRYKHTRDFCPLCFKFYASEDSEMPLNARHHVDHPNCSMAAIEHLSGAESKNKDDGIDTSMICNDVVVASSVAADPKIALIDEQMVSLIVP